MTAARQDATPESASLQVNTTFTLLLFHPAAFGAGVALALTTGAVLSILIVRDAEAVFPALSTAVPAAIWFVPSALKVAGAAQAAIPDNTSRQLNVAVTAALFHPKALGGGTGVAVMLGAVLSRLMVTEVEAVLPARSVAVPWITWFAPSALTVTGAGQDAIPEVLSEHLKVTTTLVLFQPKLSTAGAAEAEITGGSLSTPIIVSARLAPTGSFTSTWIWLFNRNATERSMVLTLELKSFGWTTWTLLRVTTALVTPEFWMCSVYWVAGLMTVKVSVTVSGSPVVLVYVFGPKAVNVPAEAKHEQRRNTEKPQREPRPEIKITTRVLADGHFLSHGLLTRSRNRNVIQFGLNHFFECGQRLDAIHALAIDEESRGPEHALFFRVCQIAIHGRLIKMLVNSGNELLPIQR